MVRFRTLKYKHFRKAKELRALADAGQLTDEDVIRYACGLVEAWDFVDAESGAPLTPGEMDELSVAQMIELFDAFNAAFSRSETISIPKANAAPSSSGSTG
jgi:hypothetical protein